jgi:hypothetical protein
MDATDWQALYLRSGSMIVGTGVLLAIGSKDRSLGYVPLTILRASGPEARPINVASKTARIICIGKIYSLRDAACPNLAPCCGITTSRT